MRECGEQNLRIEMQVAWGIFYQTKGYSKVCMLNETTNHIDYPLQFLSLDDASVKRRNHVDTRLALDR